MLLVFSLNSQGLVVLQRQLSVSLCSLLCKPESFAFALLAGAAKQLIR